MVEIMRDLPDNILGVRAEGEVTGKDYESVIMPAVEGKLKRYPKIRLLYDCRDMQGFSAAAAWDDARVGLRHIGSWEKIAVVSDEHWIIHAVKGFAFLMPCEVRVFEGSQFDAAKGWISA